MINYIKSNKSSFVKICTFVTTIILVYIVIKYLFVFFAPFLIGFIISLCLRPISVLLNKKLKINNNISVFLALIIFFLIIGTVGNIIVIKLFSEAKGFITDVPKYIERASSTIDKLNTHVSDLYELIPDGVNTAVGDIASNFVTSGTSSFGTFIKNKSINFMTTLPSLIMVLFVSIISAFFFTKDRDKIFSFINNQIPQTSKKMILLIREGILYAIGGYIKAQLKLMCITFIITLIGLLILRYPYAFFLGVIISIIDALPIFGSGFILWPWSIYNIIIGNYNFSIGLMIIYFVILISRQSLEPKLIGKQIGLHPLVTLMSIYLGLKVFGLFGFIIGPFIAVTVKTLQESNVLPKWK